MRCLVMARTKPRNILVFRSKTHDELAAESEEAMLEHCRVVLGRICEILKDVGSESKGVFGTVQGCESTVDYKGRVFNLVLQFPIPWALVIEDETVTGLIGGLFGVRDWAPLSEFVTKVEESLRGESDFADISLLDDQGYAEKVKMGEI